MRWNRKTKEERRRTARKGVRGGCEIRGVNSQGRMAESREEQKAERMKMGSNRDASANIFLVEAARTSIDTLIFI